jgi:PEP-CTERM motif
MLDFTLTNPDTFKVVIDSIQDPPQVTLYDHDRDDTVRNAIRTGGTCGVGGFPQPSGQGGSTCTVQFSFNLFDARDPADPDSDFGHWYLSSPVTAHRFLHPDVTDKDFFAAHIHVLDKGVPSPIPEPASMLLIGSGLVVLARLRWRPKAAPSHERVALPFTTFSSVRGRRS